MFGNKLSFNLQPVPDSAAFAVLDQNNNVVKTLTPEQTTRLVQLALEVRQIHDRALWHQSGGGVWTASNPPKLTGFVVPAEIGAAINLAFEKQ